MARMLPAFFDPETASPGEKLLFERLAAAPETEDWVVLHSLTLPRHIRQVEGEVDFVIIVPHLGVLCLEVKAHAHIHRDEAGLWHFGKQPPTARSPFRQASDAMHSLRQELVAKAPGLSQVPFISAVAFTHTDSDLVDPSEWHKWQLLDARDLLSRPISVHVRRILTLARAHFRDAGLAWLSETDQPSQEQVQLLIRKLRPSFELVESRKTTRTRVQQELLRFTEEQYDALDSLAALPRLLFNGPAGTGKTFLAVEAARRAAIAGRRAILLCFNRPLALWLRAEVGAQGFEIRTMHGLLHHAAGRPAPEDSPEWWSRHLPDMALERLLDSGPGYDTLVIDEAQDLITNPYLDCMDAVLAKGLAAGTWSMFSDFERQSLYGSDCDQELLRLRAPDFVPYALLTNCRNTPSIVEYTRAVAGLESGYKRTLRADNGFQPQTLYYSTPAEEGELLSGVFDRLRDRKIEPVDIVVLSHSRTNAAVANLPAHDPWRHRLDLDATNDSRIRVRTIHSFKGLESPVVIVTGVQDVESPEAQALLYVALSRATERLFVIADQAAKPKVAQMITERLFQAEDVE